MFLVGRGLSLVPGHCDGFHGKLSSFSISDDSPSITKAPKNRISQNPKKKRLTRPRKQKAWYCRRQISPYANQS
jgi:hypothetical protein